MENQIHVRSKDTGHYLRSDGSWSALRVGARTFSTAMDARSWCAQAGVANVEIIVVRDALVCMRVPIGE